MSPATEELDSLRDAVGLLRQTPVIPTRRDFTFVEAPESALKAREPIAAVGFPGFRVPVWAYGAAASVAVVAFAITLSIDLTRGPDERRWDRAGLRGKRRVLRNNSGRSRRLAHRHSDAAQQRLLSSATDDLRRSRPSPTTIQMASYVDASTDSDGDGVGGAWSRRRHRLLNLRSPLQPEKEATKASESDSALAQIAQATSVAKDSRSPAHRRPDADFCTGGYARPPANRPHA